MGSTLVGAAVGLSAAYLFFWALLHFTQLTNEPPAVSSSIPFIGPILGMIKHKSQFHVHIRDKLRLPIYTLRLPGVRMYVVNSPALIPALQRLYKTVSFAAIEAQAASSIFLLSKPAKDVIRHGLMEDDSYTGTFAAALHPALKPGANLDDMNRIAARSIAASLDKLQAEGPRITNLFDWARDDIVLASCDAVYGPHNPMRDPEILSSWFQFEPKIIMFALGMFPRILARDAFKARQRVTDAFIDYFQAGHHEQGSALVQARYQHSSQFGLTPQDIAGAEVGGLFAVVGSTGPGCFWLLHHLFSDPAVLAECRSEVSALVEERSIAGDGDSQPQTYSAIDITSVKSKCPVLLSTLQEVLRFRHISVSARVVLKDEQIMDNKIHLKQGSTLMIPVAVIHSDPESWGPTVSTFDHRRFLTQDQGGSNKATPRTAYRPFGGGHVLCPGRHFATTEILAFAALVLLRFDIVPTAADGKWKPCTITQSPATAAFPVPDDPIRVRISPRDPGRKWRVELGQSDRAIGIVAEDMASDVHV